MLKPAAVTGFCLLAAAVCTRSPDTAVRGDSPVGSASGGPAVGNTRANCGLCVAADGVPARSAVPCVQVFGFSSPWLTDTRWTWPGMSPRSGHFFAACIWLARMADVRGERPESRERLAISPRSCGLDHRPGAASIVPDGRHGRAVGRHRQFIRWPSRGGFQQALRDGGRGRRPWCCRRGAESGKLSEHAVHRAIGGNDAAVGIVTRGRNGLIEYAPGQHPPCRVGPPDRRAA
jgi:hypothetical protein